MLCNKYCIQWNCRKGKLGPKKAEEEQELPSVGFLWGDDRALEIAKGHSYITPNKLNASELFFKMVRVSLQDYHFNRERKLIPTWQ